MPFWRKDPFDRFVGLRLASSKYVPAGQGIPPVVINDIREWLDANIRGQVVDDRGHLCSITVGGVVQILQTYFVAGKLGMRIPLVEANVDAVGIHVYVPRGSDDPIWTGRFA